MDPNETLNRIRQQADAVLHSRGLQVDRDELAAMLARNFQELDEWLCRGGFAPRAWQLLDVQWRDVVGGPPEPLGGPIPGVGGSHLPEEGPYCSSCGNHVPTHGHALDCPRDNG